MRVARVRLWRVRLPLVHYFRTSSHGKSSIEHVLVELTGPDGVVGWGEIATPADPYFGPETTDTAWLVATRYLVPAVLATDWETPEELEEAWRRVRGHEFARAGFVGAAWDLHCRLRDLSLSAALGGTRDAVEAGVSLGIEATVDDLLAEVGRQVSSGYGRVKLKIAPGWDLEPVRAVRAAHPDLDLHVDANGAYPVTQEATDLMGRLDAYGLTMIEQPFAPRELVAHAQLQARLETPVCLDESIVEEGDLATMIALRAGRILNIKVSRMGGLTRARRAHDLALDAGIPVWCGGMHEFGVGRAANVALSSLPGFTLPSDVSGSDKYYARDVVRPAVVAVGGRVEVPTGAGIGHEVDLHWVRESAVDAFDSAGSTALTGSRP